MNHFYSLDYTYILAI